MKQLKIVLFIILLISFYNSFGQEKNKIQEIKLSIKHALLIPNNSVNITLKKNVHNKDKVDVEVVSKPMYDIAEWEHTKIDTVLKKSKVNF